MNKNKQIAEYFSSESLKDKDQELLEAKTLMKQASLEELREMNHKIADTNARLDQEINRLDKQIEMKKQELGEAKDEAKKSNLKANISIAISIISILVTLALELFQIINS